MTNNKPMYAVSIFIDNEWIVVSKSMHDYQDAQRVFASFTTNTRARLYRLIPQLIEEYTPTGTSRLSRDDRARLSSGPYDDDEDDQ